MTKIVYAVFFTNPNETTGKLGYFDRTKQAAARILEDHKQHAGRRYEIVEFIAEEVAREKVSIPDD